MKTATKEEVLIAGIYARASLGRERQGETIEHQIEMIEEFAKRSELNVKFDKKYIYEDEDSAFKTTLMQRESMRRLLNDIESGIVKVVFFKGISRFARDSGESITTAKRLKNLGVRVISLEENYDSDRDDPTMFQIYAVMAEQESRKTSIRVALGNKSKARNGIFPNSKVPLGYVRVKNIKDEKVKADLLASGTHKDKLYPNEKADIVRTIFRMYVEEGVGRKKITSYLNLNGFKNDKGKDFQEKHIKDILENRAYIGDVVYGKTRYNYIEDIEKQKKIQKQVNIDEEDWVITENAHPPIIERDIFFKAQIIMRDKEFKHNAGGKFNSAKHPLTGLLYCGKCGGVMVCQKRTNKKKNGEKKEYRYYVCSTYHKKGRHICDQANVNADDLEEAIYNKVKSEIENIIDEIKNDINKIQINDSQFKDIETSLNNIERELTKKYDALKNVYERMNEMPQDMFENLRIGFQDEINDLNRRKKELESKLKVLNKKDDCVNLQELFSEYMQVKISNLANLRTCFHEWIEKITIEDKQVKLLKLKYKV